jgi:hypothetical protein
MNEKEYLTFTEAYKKVLKKEKLKGFAIHLLAYVVVNTSLFITNFDSNPAVFWGCLLGWGSGVVAIVIFKIIPIDKQLDSQLAQAENMSGVKNS